MEMSHEYWMVNEYAEECNLEVCILQAWAMTIKKSDGSLEISWQDFPFPIFISDLLSSEKGDNGNGYCDIN